MNVPHTPGVALNFARYAFTYEDASGSCAASGTPLNTQRCEAGIPAADTNAGSTLARPMKQLDVVFAAVMAVAILLPSG